MPVEQKIWGETDTLESNHAVSIHRAVIKAGYRCSKHIHKHRFNGFYVESGKLRIRVWDGDEQVHVLEAGQYLSIAPGVLHRFECVQDTVLLEIYWVGPVDLNDIEREDIGGRI